MRRAALPDAVISEPDDNTVMDSGGAVRSIQAADVTMPEGELDELWTPLYLERLARTYWKYLSRVSLGLIRVEYTETERRVVLLRRPFVLLRFRAPEYEITDGRGIVRWRIRDGVLVAKRDEGYLEIDVRRTEADEARLRRRRTSRSRSRTSIRGSPPGWRAGSTRSRSRASTCSSRTGSCARSPAASSRCRPSGASPAPDEQPVNVGDTPWAVVVGAASPRSPPPSRPRGPVHP